MLADVILHRCRALNKTECLCSSNGDCSQGLINAAGEGHRKGHYGFGELIIFQEKHCNLGNTDISIHSFVLINIFLRSNEHEA